MRQNDESLGNIFLSFFGNGNNNSKSKKYLTCATKNFAFLEWQEV